MVETKTKTKAKKPTRRKAQVKPVAKKTAPKKSGDFAVILTGGKQYIVREGDILNIERLLGTDKEGQKITFDKVLLVDNGKDTKVGDPYIKGAKVEAELVLNGRDKKINVIHYKNKITYFKKQGHRQQFSKVKITKI